MGRPFMSKILLLTSACEMLTLMSLVTIVISDYNKPAIRCLMKPYDMAVETYCFIHSTFTFPNSPKRFDEDEDELLKGEESKIIHKYYFWMPYLLALQAFLFELPCWWWNFFEDNFRPKQNEITKMKQSAYYFVATLNHNNGLALGFLICEILGVASFGANIFLMDWYLQGRFTQAIPDILINLFALDKLDTKYDEIFPKLSSCTFLKYGVSGSIERRDALCIMPRNLLAGRIYTLHFFVYLVSVIIAGLCLILRIAEYLSPRLRLLVLLKRIPCMKEKSDLLYIMKFSNLGDWFILHHFSGTMINFKDWLKDVYTELQKPKAHHALPTTTNEEI